MNINNKSKCRTCLKPNTTLRLLSTKPKMFKINKTYMELLKFVANVEIDADDEKGNRAQGICCSCCKRIRESYTFIKQVRKCNKHFLKGLWEKPERINSVAKNARAEDDKFEPAIKQEVDKFEDDFSGQPKEEMDADTRSSISNDNFDHLPAELTDTDTQHSACKETNADVAIKTESEHMNALDELLPVCILNETAFTEENINNDSDLPKRPESSNYDPLDSNELDEEPKSVSVDDDKLLPVRCDECERVFPNSILLNRHKKDTHIPNELKIQCPNCPVRFSRRYNMYAHMRTFHKTETVRKHQIQPRKLIKTDVCSQCNRAYSDKYKLLAHIKNKHGPESKPKKEKQPPKRYLCTLCGLTCSSQSNLDIHYRRHTGEKPFKCDFCGRGYARQYDVQVHRRIHTGETPFKCTICEKAFKRSNKLKIHMRTHTNERPYKCTQCEKAFKQSKDLNIHKRTHTGERPYKCGVCNSTFTQSNSLKLHQTKTKHLENINQETEFTDITNTLS